MTIGTIVIALIAGLIAWRGNYLTAMAVMLTVVGINAGGFYVLSQIFEAARNTPDLDARTVNILTQLFNYSSGWLTIFCFACLGLIGAFYAQDRRRKAAEKQSSTAVPAFDPNDSIA